MLRDLSQHRNRRRSNDEPRGLLRCIRRRSSRESSSNHLVHTNTSSDLAPAVAEFKPGYALRDKPVRCNLAALHASTVLLERVRDKAAWI